MEQHLKNMAFLGRGWSFPPAFSRNSARVEMAEGITDIKESLHILFSTALGERVMQPRYGCNLGTYLFEPMDASLKAYIKDLVRTAVLYHEPRIDLNDVTLTSDDAAGRVEIEIEFTVRSTNARYNQVFPFYRDEGGS